MGGGARARRRLPALRGRRRARHRRPRADRGFDRRLRAVRRRDRGARRARRLRAADPRRDGQDRVGRAGELRERVARISPLHAAARMGGARDSRRAAVGRSPARSTNGGRKRPSGSPASGGRICSEVPSSGLSGRVLRKREKGSTASAPASRRGSRRSRAASCGRASRPRRISPAADTAGTWNRRGLRAAPASRSGRCRGR